MSQLDYALVGNCQISSLLDRRGTHVWCCMPRFDSSSIFAELLGGPEAGFWSIEPASEFRSEQRYIENTNVVVTRYECQQGDRFDVIDFAPRFRLKDDYFRPAQLVRIIKPVSGAPRVRMRLSPAFGYGHDRARVVPTSSGLLYEGPGQVLHLTTDIPSSYITGEVPFELNSTRYAVLSFGTPFEPPLKFGCEEYLDRTVAYWKTWVKHSSIPFEFQREVIRSALTLKLHIFEDTGAIIAATTTSIPESPHGGRCWDYRYCWLRDSYFVINTLNKLGHFDEMESFIQYLFNIAINEPTDQLQPVYGVGGEKILEERELPWLKGFQGIGPIRVGNAAYTHHQHDVYGEMVLAITPLFFDLRLDRHDQTRAFQAVKRLVDKAISSFELADAGLWEFRSEHKHYLFSKLLSWAAVDRGIRIANKIGQTDLANQWIRHAERMRSEIDRHGWNPEIGIYTQAYNGVTGDASNLLMYQLNYVNPRDERFKSTVQNYLKLLKRGELITRYVNQDDFGVPETAFTICSFWMVEALQGIGMVNESRELFRLLCSRSNHVGLLSEDIDSTTGDLWGNFPQTYSHVGLINSAMRLSKSWDDAF